MLAELWPLAAKHGVKFVLNAGGLNPEGAREAIARAFRDKGWKARIATVTGDSVLERIDELRAAGEPLAHMDTGADIAAVRDRMLFANAYLGAQPIAEALARGADIVLTGRVADAALSLGPLAHEFGWQWDDWDRLAAGLDARPPARMLGPGLGRQLRLGRRMGQDARTMRTSAIRSPRYREDGSAVFTKPPGTGGRVSFDTIRQQLLYEVHNPHAYFSPDVVLDMGTLKFDDEGNDRVRISGASGAARPPNPEDRRRLPGRLDGHRHDRLRLARGLRQVRKKRRDHPDAWSTERGWAVEDTNVEYIGYNSLLGANADPDLPRPAERMLPAHDHPHQGQARRRRVRPPVPLARAVRARRTSAA